MREPNALITMELLRTLTTATIPLFIYSRIPQIWTNFKNGNTGVLNGVTCMMQVAGNAARVFTTLQEVNDMVLLMSVAIPFVLNVTLFAQVVYYSYLGFGTPAVKVESKKQQ